MRRDLSWPRLALVQAARDAAGASSTPLTVGPIYSSDVFYEPNDDARHRHTANGVLCVEMETAALYAIASLEGAEALTLLTMTDHLVTGDHLSTDERQQGVDQMVELARDRTASRLTWRHGADQDRSHARR